MEDLINLYKTNKEFSRYVDAYCKKHEINVDTAISHRVVQSYSESVLEHARMLKESL